MTLALAAAGHAVTGVDPALESLRAARAKPGSDRVTWLHFHGWCKRVCQEAGMEREYNRLFARGSGQEEAEDEEKPPERLFDTGVVELVPTPLKLRKLNVREPMSQLLPT